jgi:hypothetical protein
MKHRKKPSSRSGEAVRASALAIAKIVGSAAADAAWLFLCGEVGCLFRRRKV